MATAILSGCSIGGDMMMYQMFADVHTRRAEGWSFRSGIGYIYVVREEGIEKLETDSLLDTGTIEEEVLPRSGNSIFYTDEQVETFIKNKAAAGSEYHQLVIAYLAAVKLRGYREVIRDIVKETNLAIAAGDFTISNFSDQKP